MKVSICLVTYNHGKFIQECLKNIVSQQTNFKFEVVVGDDFSSDETRKIISEYAQKYPSLIVPLLHEKNLGTKECPGKNNFLTTLYACKGEYIVHIEGDDYFCDDQKLQRQVDFLDANPQYAACFHNALMKFEDGSNEQDYNINPANQKTEIVPTDLLLDKEVWFMATASVMFRRKLIGEKLPIWFSKCKSGDIPLYVILSHQAPIGYLPRVMSVYRRHTAGLSYTDNIYDADFIHNRIFMYSHINKHTHKEYSEFVEPILAKYYLMLPHTKQYTNTFWARLYYTFRSLYYQYPKQFTFKEVLMYYAFSENTIKKAYRIFKFFK